VPARVDGRLPQVVAVLEHHQGNAFQLADPDRPAARERMFRADRQHQFLVHQRLRLHPRPIHGKDDDGQIDLAFFEAANEVLRAGLVHRELQPTMLSEELGENRREQVGRQARGGAEGQPAATEPEQVPDGGRTRIAIGQYLASPGEEGLAGAGQGDLLAGPVKEGGAQLVLQGRYGTAY
jgi:hypothetical protein